jgi:hypothetical protein
MLPEVARLLSGRGGSGCEADVGERRVSREAAGDSEAGELGGRDMVVSRMMF